MEKHNVEILNIQWLNHNVLKVVTNKPENYMFEPGQATEIAINTPDWKNKTRPFTFTNLPNDENLEFTIKIYPEHKGVTERLANLKKGDELILRNTFGAIKFKDKGTFIAGGAGVTPFLSIFRHLDKIGNITGNALLFANKTEKDIFLKDEFENLLGRKYVNILSEEETDKYLYGHIDQDFLTTTIKDYTQYFYVCGPPEMTNKVVDNLVSLGADKTKIIIEDY
ncbi:FAD-binding oxidoreductase [uncultured Zobellia sp.]|uniref:FAD-binding oxidoreductase n=1 Tax=uncultured Zobellia sp. TaxID=255433 RepID=UPI00259AAB3C|nr:FAD-binding oxidoreductase [uncultured Zobellia sp.]